MRLSSDTISEIESVVSLASFLMGERVELLNDFGLADSDISNVSQIDMFRASSLVEVLNCHWSFLGNLMEMAFCKLQQRGTHTQQSAKNAITEVIQQHKAKISNFYSRLVGTGYNHDFYGGESIYNVQLGEQKSHNAGGMFLEARADDDSVSDRLEHIVTTRVSDRLLGLPPPSDEDLAAEKNFLQEAIQDNENGARYCYEFLSHYKKYYSSGGRVDLRQLAEVRLSWLAEVVSLERVLVFIDQLAEDEERVQALSFFEEVFRKAATQERKFLQAVAQDGQRCYELINHYNSNRFKVMAYRIRWLAEVPGSQERVLDYIANAVKCDPSKAKVIFSDMGNWDAQRGDGHCLGYFFSIKPWYRRWLSLIDFLAPASPEEKLIAQLDGKQVFFLLISGNVDGRVISTLAKARGKKMDVLQHILTLAPADRVQYLRDALSGVNDRGREPSSLARFFAVQRGFRKTDTNRGVLGKVNHAFWSDPTTTATSSCGRQQSTGGVPLEDLSSVPLTKVC